MRCLHCGKRLSLLRKFSDAEFCSNEHRLEFQQQQSDLALARLIEAQNRIEKPKPAAKPLAPPKSSKKNKAAEPEPVIPMARTVNEVFFPVGTPGLHVPPLSVDSVPAAAGLPAVELALAHRGFAAPGPLPLATPPPAPPPNLQDLPTRALFRLALKLRARDIPNLEPTPREARDLHPLAQPALAGQSSAHALHPSCLATVPADTALPTGRFTADVIECAPPPPEPLPARAPRLALPLAPVPPPPARLLAVCDSLPSILTPTAPRAHIAPIPPPPPETLPAQAPAIALHLAPVAPAATRSRATIGALQSSPAHSAPALFHRAPAVCVTAAGLAALPLQPALASRSRAVAPQSISTPPAPRVPAVPAPARLPAGLRASVRSARLPLKALAAAAGAATPGFSPELQPGPRATPVLHATPLLPGLSSPPLPLAISASAAADCPVMPWLTGLLDAAREAAYPRSAFRPLPPEPHVQETEDEAPPLQRTLPVQLSRPADCGRGGPAWAGPVMALADWPDPRMPGCRLDVDQADGSGPRRQRQTESGRKRGPSFSFANRLVPGGKFWRHAPADLKWVALGLPLLLVLVVYSFRSSAPRPAGPADQIASTAPAAQTAIGEPLNAVQKVILNRAAVKLFDDFRGGLGAWSGDEGWSKSWKYGAASFLEPGQLALYAPSVGMRDYTFQFLGQIGRRSLNWVFRAEDTKNYYSMRIVITQGGPLPEAHLVRSLVLNGKEREVKSLPIPFTVRPDTLYLVKMEVRGADFTTYMQGQVVDSFTDARLERGGVGFQSARGEQSLLRWVEVTHQYDFLGRLCALVAPYDLTAHGRQAN